jgi:hypothetical protein
MKASCLAVACMLVLGLAMSASASVIGQWTNPNPDYPWQSGWTTGNTKTIDLTVPAGFEATITDWQFEGLSNWTAFTIELTASVETTSLGSASAMVSGNNLAPFTGTADPADLVLPAGAYTLSFFGQDKTGVGDGSSWIALNTITVNGAVNPIPEPATMSLLVLGGLAMLRRSRQA